MQTGLYIHLPWCVQKCPYCDFNSHALKQPLAEQDYVDALKRDMAFEAEHWSERTFSSIFFGGGTPSLFSADTIDEIIQAAAACFSLDTHIEITLEANPGTAEASHFKGYTKAGVNRLSMGLQSLDDDMLHRLGRIHTSEEAIRAFEMARAAGFDNINVDLMFGLPEQSMAAAIHDLEQALELKPEHLSWYQLTLEPNTAFAHSPPTLPTHDICHQMQQRGIGLLADKKFERYEVSAFSQAGKQCRHNLNYWRFGDYLGIGAGAHGKFSDETITRYARVRHPKDYLALSGTHQVFQKQAPVAADQYLFEFLLNRLRLKESFELAEAKKHTGLDTTEIIGRLERPIRQNLLQLTGNQCQTTERGFNYIDDILVGILPADER